MGNSLLSGSHLAGRGVQRRGGHSDHRGLSGREGPPPPAPVLAFGLRMGCVSHDLHTPLEQMGEPVLMDGVNDIKDSGLE